MVADSGRDQFDVSTRMSQRSLSSVLFQETIGSERTCASRHRQIVTDSLMNACPSSVERKTKLCTSMCVCSCKPTCSPSLLFRLYIKLKVHFNATAACLGQTPGAIWPMAVRIPVKIHYWYSVGSHRDHRQSRLKNEEIPSKIDCLSEIRCQDFF